MRIKKLSLLNYKNIKQVDLNFSTHMNCFFGNNGMGKTNLLDAIYYLTFFKSHGHTLDKNLVRHDKELCTLKGLYEREGANDEIFCAIRLGMRKVFRRNQKEYKKLSDHIGLIKLVLVSPDDIELIKGGSIERRQFIDLVIMQQDTRYLNALIQYNQLCKQRNALLKAQNRDATTYDVIEEQMVSYATFIYEKRKQVIQDFVPVFNNYYQRICSSAENVSLHYISQLDSLDFAQQLKNNRERDLIIGFTTIGTHKDDLEMLLDEELIRRIGSQGQKKTFLIALKLAQYKFMADLGNCSPLLLLDDIFDKLDAKRVEEIIKLVAGKEFGQIFITDTNRKYLDEILKNLKNDYALFKVDQGEIEPMKIEA